MCNYGLLLRAYDVEKTPKFRILSLTPTADEYRALASALNVREGHFQVDTEEGPQLGRIAAIGQGQNVAFESTMAALRGVYPSVAILSGIAGARHDADFGPFDCIAATSCIDYSLSERLPGGRSRPTGIPLGPSTLLATELNDRLLQWEPKLLTGIDAEAKRVGVTAPAIGPVEPSHVTAKDPDLRKAIKAALNRHASRTTSQFISANVCSGNDLHKDADYLQSLVGLDKRLWAMEMEFANVIRACEGAAVPCFMIRSISDVFGAREK